MHFQECKQNSTVKLNKKIVDRNYSIFKVNSDSIYFCNNEYKDVIIMNMLSGQSMKIEAHLKLLTPVYARNQIPTISTIVGRDYLYNVFHPHPLLTETDLVEDTCKSCQISDGVKISLEGILRHESFYNSKARSNI